VHAQQSPMPWSTISNVVLGFLKCSTIVSNKQASKPRNLRAWDARHLGQNLLHNQTITLVGVIENITMKVFWMIIFKAIRSLGYMNRVVAWEPYRSQRHKTNRLAFTCTHTLGQLHIDKKKMDLRIIFWIWKSQEFRVWRLLSRQCAWEFGTNI